MNNTERMALIKKVAELIFKAKATLTMDQWRAVKPQSPEIVMWNARGFVNDTLYGVDVDLNVGDRIVQIRFIEQNPSKNSQYAEMAKRGDQIIWLIDRKAKENAFLGRIHNGKWHPSGDRAYQPVQYNTAVAPTAAPTAQTVPTNPEVDIPDIPHNIDVPDYVIQAIEEDTYVPDWVNELE
jgi:hypothetical protein